MLNTGKPLSRNFYGEISHFPLLSVVRVLRTLSPPRVEIKRVAVSAAPAVPVK